VQSQINYYIILYNYKAIRRSKLGSYSIRGIMLW